MAYYVNKDNLTFRNINKLNDSIIYKFYETKKYKARNKYTDNDLYINPLNPNVDLFFALSLHIDLEI